MQRYRNETGLEQNWIVQKWDFEYFKSRSRSNKKYRKIYK